MDNKINALLNPETGFNVSSRYGLIKTQTLIDQFTSQGYQVRTISTAKVRSHSKEGFQTHLVRLTNEALSFESRTDCKPEIIINTSHDGSKALRLYLGVYRFACANGLIVGQNFGFYRIIHTQGALDQALVACAELSKQVKRLEQQIDNWSKLILGAETLYKFYLDAAKLLDLDATFTSLPLSFDSIRSDDNADDLWTVFNRVQERLLSGGVRYTRLTDQNRCRRGTSRRIKSIDRQVKINRQLFDLADSYYKRLVA